MIKLNKIILILFFFILFCCSESESQVGHFISDRQIPITKVSGFTTNDVYYGTDLIDYNLTGFSWWVVIDPVQNETTNNIQMIFGNLSWNASNTGWGFRTFQGTVRPMLDQDNIGSATIHQKVAQGTSTGYGELGYMQVLHCVIRNNVVYMYKNGKIIGYEGVDGPGLSKPSKIAIASNLGVGIGGFPGSPSQRKPFDGGFISGGICQSTGLTDQQVADHYAALLADNPYATPTGATNAWKAPDAGATWTDHIGGYVMTRFGTPTVTQTKMPFYPAYDPAAPYGDTAPMWSQMPNTLGEMDIMTIGDSRTGVGSYRFICERDKVAKGMSNMRFVGKYPVPPDYYFSQLGYNDVSNAMPGVSARECLDGTYNFPPLASELITHDPEVVVMWFGHNSGNSYARMQGDILEVINTIYAYDPNIRILIITEVTGVREGSPSGSGLSMQAKYHHYNNWIQRYVVSNYRKQGYKISASKSDTVIKWDSETDWLDNVHFVNPDVNTNLTEGVNKLGMAMWPKLRYLMGYN